MTARLSKADLAVEHILRAIRDDGAKAYLLGFGTHSFDLLTEAYAKRHGKDVEALRKEFWAACRPQRVVRATEDTISEQLAGDLRRISDSDASKFYTVHGVSPAEARLILERAAR